MKEVVRRRKRKRGKEKGGRERGKNGKLYQLNQQEIQWCFSQQVDGIGCKGGLREACFSLEEGAFLWGSGENGFKNIKIK